MMKRLHDRRRAAVCLRVFPGGECVRGLRALEKPAGSAVPLRGGHEGEEGAVSGPHRCPLPSAGRNPPGLLCGHRVAEQLPHLHTSGAVHTVFLSLIPDLSKQEHNECYGNNSE